MMGLDWSAGVFSDRAAFFAAAALRIGVGRNPFTVKTGGSDGGKASSTVLSAYWK